MQTNVNEAIYHLSFDELVREAERSDNLLAKMLVLRANECFTQLEKEASVAYSDEMEQLKTCLKDMRGMLQEMVDNLIAAKGGKRKSLEAVETFKENCENMPSDYLEIFSILWDIET